MESASLFTVTPPPITRCVTPEAKASTEAGSPFKAFRSSQDRSPKDSPLIRGISRTTTTTELTDSLVTSIHQGVIKTLTHPPRTPSPLLQSGNIEVVHGLFSEKDDNALVAPRVPMISSTPAEISLTPLMSPDSDDLSSPTTILREFGSPLHSPSLSTSRYGGSDVIPIPFPSLDDCASSSAHAVGDDNTSSRSGCCAEPPLTLEASSSTSMTIYRAPKNLERLINDLFHAVYSTREPLYARYTECSTASILAKARVPFDPVMSPLLAERGVVMVTGSDGRRENVSSASPQELVVAFPTRPSSPLRRGIQSVVADNPRLFHHRFDVVMLDTTQRDHVVTRLVGDKLRVIPTVPLDAAFIVGDTTTFESYQRQAFEAIHSMTSVSAFVADFLKPAMTQLRKDHYREDGKHIDIEDGTLHVDHGRYIKTSKYGLLRPIQYLLAKIIVDAIKDHKISEAQYRQIGHIQTIDRLTLMSEWGLLKASPKEVKYVAWAYSIGMLWHHLGYYAEMGVPTTIQVPPDILKEVTETIMQFVRNEGLYISSLEPRKR